MVSDRANRSDSPIRTVVLPQDICDLWLRRCKIPQTSQPPEEDGVAAGQRGGFQSWLIPSQVRGQNHLSLLASLHGTC